MTRTRLLRALSVIIDSDPRQGDRAIDRHRQGLSDEQLEVEMEEDEAIRDVEYSELQQLHEQQYQDDDDDTSDDDYQVSPPHPPPAPMPPRPHDFEAGRERDP